MAQEELQEQSLRPKMGSSNVRMSPITGKNLGSKQDLEQGLRYNMGDPSGVYPSIGDPRGISPILEQNLKSKSKLNLGYLPALTTEVIKGNGQPKDGFLKEPFIRGSSMVQRASTTHSTGSKDIGIADIATAKDVSALCLQLVTRA
jgi:hypothetical protein